MDFSSNYHVRKEKLKNLEVPSITETKQNLGEKLTKIFIDQCPESLAAEMSIDQKLNGPGPDLWTSPSDLLINKLVLKPPLTNKHIKALTHEGILEIGYQVEQKQKKLQDEEMKKALHEQEVWLRFMAAKETEKAVQDAIAREQELFRLKLIQLNEEFEALVQDLMSRVEERLRETYEEMLAVETEKILREQEALWTQKIEEAVEETVNTLTSKFLKELELQEKEIVDVFQAKMDAEKEKYAVSLEAEREAFNALVKQLKHNIHCNNIANLMYMLCAERRKCFLEQAEIVDSYEEKLISLETAKTLAEIELEQMKADRDEKLIKIEVREECMRQILEQFQKCINFALRAVPVQAEFLLDINKMMTFELAQAIAKLNHVHPAKQLMPWRSTVRITPDQKKSDLFDKYHDCLNETEPPSEDDQEFGTNEMYSVNYKNRLYVREDFRNMISNGDDIKPTNMIWSKDIENLITVLKGSIQENSIDEPSLEKDKSQCSNVHFHSNKCFDQGSIGVGLLAANDSMDLQKSAKSHSVEENQNTIQPACAILASPDSLTIVKKIDRSPIKYADRSKELIVKQFSCDTLTLSVRKIRESTRPSMETPCKTFSEETLKLTSNTKKKRNDEEKKFKDQGTSTQQVQEFAAVPPKVASSFVESARKKRKGMSLLVLHKDSIELAKSTINVEESKIKDIIRSNALQKNGLFLLDMPTTDGANDIDFEPVAKIYGYNKQKVKSVVMQPPPPIKDAREEVKPVVVPPTPPIKECVEVADVEVRENFLNKPGVAKVLGKEGTEHLQSHHEFTVHRIHSIVDILKKDNSLIRMFTRCN